jgi:hypothetical protein
VTVKIERAKDRVSWMAQISTSGNLSKYDEKMMAECVTRSPYLWRSELDGKLLCVWGLIPPTLLSNQAYLWLYATKEAEKHTFILVRYSQLMVKIMLGHFDQLVGHCVAGQDRSIRWLRWLGAEFKEPNGKLIPFVIRKKDGSS